MSDERGKEEISAEINEILVGIEADSEMSKGEETSQTASDPPDASGVSSSSTAERVLEVLIDDARATYDEIAERTDVSKPTVRKYITQLEDKDVIQGYSVEVDPKKLDRIMAKVAVEIEEASYDEAIAALIELDAVQSVYSTQSGDRVILTVTATDFHAFSTLLSDSIQPIDGVESTHPSILDKRHV